VTLADIETSLMFSVDDVSIDDCVSSMFLRSRDERSLST
jgi:hypothetical protein